MQTADGSEFKVSEAARDSCTIYELDFRRSRRSAFRTSNNPDDGCHQGRREGRILHVCGEEGIESQYEWNCQL